MLQCSEQLCGLDDGVAALKSVSGCVLFSGIEIITLTKGSSSQGDAWEVPWDRLPLHLFSPREKPGWLVKATKSVIDAGLRVLLAKLIETGDFGERISADFFSPKSNQSHNTLKNKTRKAELCIHVCAHMEIRGFRRNF